MTRISAYLGLFLLLLLQCDVQKETVDNGSPFLTIEPTEIQSLVADMSFEEKIGQLLILETTLGPELNEDSIYAYARNNQISGVILSGLDVIQYMRIVDNCTAFGKNSFVHGTRENVSICNQFANTQTFPSLAAIQACQNDSLLRNTYDIFEKQLHAFNFDFVIGPNISTSNEGRSFDARNYATDERSVKTNAYTQFNRFSKNDVFSFANSLDQFIDVKNDSTKVDNPSLDLLDNLNKRGLSGLMVGRSFFQDERFDNQAFDFLKEHLHQEIGFEGLLIGEAEVGNLINLLTAGLDMFIVKDVKTINKRFKELYESGFLTDIILDEKVARVLKAKEWIQENKKDRNMDVEAANYLAHYEEYDFLIRSLEEQSIALTNNHKFLLPFKEIGTKKFTIQNVGKFDARLFTATFKKFANFEFFDRFDHVNEVLDLSDLQQRLGDVNVFLYDGAALTSAQRQEFIDKLNSLENANTVVINFGDPAFLAPFKKSISSLQIFDNTQYTQSGAAQLLFGGYSTTAKILADVNDFIEGGTRNRLIKTRLKYADPREVGIDPTDLVGIDAIVNTAIDDKAIPGCQVLVAKEGKIIYSKGFGYQTYDNISEIETDHLYDLASITKVASTTLGIMKLEEQGKLDLKDRLKNSIEISNSSRLKNIYLRDLLLHRSNLQPNMPISDFVGVEDSLLVTCNDLYCQKKTAVHAKAVAKDFYINNEKISTLWDNVYKLKPYKKSKYRYSDVNFNILQKVIENKAKRGLNNYIDREFYTRLGLRNCAYNPHETNPMTKLVPTEFDKKWRKQILRGFVHDESAAIQGGVAGNAGLFSNAEDLAYLFQMLLNGGDYGGRRFLKKETIDKFVTPPYYSKRGYGFDKPRGRYTESCSAKASKKTYGHSGFTGTCVWVDPETELVYIFLSNRIYPSIDNRKLFKEKYRGRIHSVIYDAIDSYQWVTPDPEKPNIKTKLIQS